MKHTFLQYRFDICYTQPYIKHSSVLSTAHYPDSGVCAGLMAQPTISLTCGCFSLIHFCPRQTGGPWNQSGVRREHAVCIVCVCVLVQPRVRLWVRACTYVRICGCYLTFRADDSLQTSRGVGGPASQLSWKQVSETGALLSVSSSDCWDTLAFLSRSISVDFSVAPGCVSLMWFVNLMVNTLSPRSLQTVKGTVCRISSWIFKHNLSPCLIFI